MAMPKVCELGYYRQGVLPPALPTATGQEPANLAHYLPGGVHGALAGCGAFGGAWVDSLPAGARVGLGTHGRLPARQARADGQTNRRSDPGRPLCHAQGWPWEPPGIRGGPRASQASTVTRAMAINFMTAAGAGALGAGSSLVPSWHRWLRGWTWARRKQDPKLNG